MNLENYFPNVEESAEWIRGRINIKPRMAVTLSGGLDAFAQGLNESETLKMSDIPHFPKPRAEGHSGKIVFGKYKNMPVVALCGRNHFYEGFAPQEIVFHCFVLAALGCEIYMTTNAVGGINKSFNCGDIMMVEDHINMMGVNPLVGLTVQQKKDQFPSLTNAYDSALRSLAKDVAAKLRIELKSGVYVATMGPSYETKAEIRAYRQMGADAAGMSTVPEVIAANFLKMKVLSFSCIANPAADLHTGTMTHAEVLASMNALAPKAVKLLQGVVEEIAKKGV